MRLLVSVVGILLLASCAARGPSPRLVAEFAAAEALFSEGCYRCLEESLETFERLAASPRPPPDAARRAFDTAVLLAMRAKELGLPADAPLERARALGARLPTVPAPLLSPTAYIDAVDAFLGEVSGFDPEERRQRMVRQQIPRPNGGPPPARVALEAVRATDMVADYVALALDCEDARARQSLKVDDIRQRRGTQAVFRFRLALCAFGDAPIGVIREQNPRWTDTLMTEGRRQLTLRPIGDVLKAAEYFQAGVVAFPQSSALALALGTAQNALTQYDAALATFDQILASQPTHRDALLGRVMSLSYLTRHPAAIASATQMIDLGNWHIGDAHYWRAWNRYQLQQFDPAWSDIEAATKLQVNTAVYTLAGFIAYARKELDVAIDRFDRAFRMDQTNCEAVWTAGLVHVEQQGWALAAPKFSRAMSCFAADAAEAENEIAEIGKATYAEQVKATRIGVARKRIDTSLHRQAQAAFNAASAYLRLRDRDLALTHVATAAEHALLAEKSVALRAAIEKLPQ